MSTSWPSKNCINDYHTKQREDAKHDTRGNGLHLIEAGIGEGMFEKRALVNISLVDGMRFRRRIVYGIGKDPQVINCLPCHPSVRVIVHPTHSAVVELYSWAVEIAIHKVIFMVVWVVC